MTFINIIMGFSSSFNKINWKAEKTVRFKFVYNISRRDHFTLMSSL